MQQQTKIRDLNCEWRIQLKPDAALNVVFTFTYQSSELSYHWN